MNHKLFHRVLTADLASVLTKHDLGQRLIEFIGKEILEHLIGDKLQFAYLLLYDLEKNLWVVDRKGLLPYYCPLRVKIEYEQVLQDWEKLSEQMKKNNVSLSFRDCVFRFASKRQPWIVISRIPHKRHLSLKSNIILTVNSNEHGARMLAKKLDITVKSAFNTFKTVFKHLSEGYFIEWNYVYYFVTPIIRKRAVSGLSIFTDKKLERNKLIELTYILCYIFQKIDLYLLEKAFMSSALHSAVAAIMARNMSHNPGSHGLAYLIAEIEEKIRRGQSLNVGEEKDLKNFLEYAKARMDFVAEVTTYWREMPWLEQLTL